MSYQNIEVSFDNELGTITLKRPPMNVLNIALLTDINQALSAWHGKKDLKVVLFKSREKCFSAGADITELDGDQVFLLIKAFLDMFRNIERLGCLTAASVHGMCFGGGCELTVWCDLVIAAEGTKISVPEVKIGMFPPIAAYIMPRIIGRKAAYELILSGKTITAEEACKIGLVSKVVKDEDFEQETAEFLKPYLKLSAEVLRLAKKAIDTGMKEDLEARTQGD